MLNVRGFARRHRYGLLVGAALGVVMTAQTFVTTGFKGDAVTVMPTGQLLASNCMQCHGTGGTNGAFNELAGIPVEDMMNKLHDQQTHSSIMGAQARGYTDAELLKIATYFASLPKQ